MVAGVSAAADIFEHLSAWSVLLPSALEHAMDRAADADDPVVLLAEGSDLTDRCPRVDPYLAWTRDHRDGVRACDLSLFRKLAG